MKYFLGLILGLSISTAASADSFYVCEKTNFIGVKEHKSTSYNSGKFRLTVKGNKKVNLKGGGLFGDGADLEIYENVNNEFWHAQYDSSRAHFSEGEFYYFAAFPHPSMGLAFMVTAKCEKL